MISKAIPKSDLLGAIASGLCAVHCLATPFLFMAQSCSVSGCSELSPSWWSSIDYVFIGITFLAVYQSGKNTHAPWLKYALYVSWGILSLLIINEKLVFWPLPGLWKYSMAFILITLHLYNLKLCKCAEESCCVANSLQKEL